MSSTVQRREIFGWCCYDFANSAYTTIVITVVFPVYFSSVVCGGSDSALALWGWMIGISQALVILLSPGLGMLADLQGAKKKFLILTTLFCSASTAFLAVSEPGWIVYAAVFLILSNLAYALGENLCAGFLPEISTPTNCARISGYGWSFGYCGGLLALGFAIGLIEWFGSSATTSRWIFVMTGLFFATAALPTFLLLRERKEPARGISWVTAFRSAWQQQRHLTGELTRQPQLLRFFLAFLAFMSGLYVIITYASLFAGKELGFSQTELIGLFAMLQISSAVGAFAFGFLADRLGPGKILSASLIIWILVCAGAAFCPSKSWFLVVGNLAGLGIGSTQSTSRAVVALLAPEGKSAEFFGFWGSFGKLAAIIGPVSFGITASFLGFRPAILLVALFFLLGLFLLLPLRSLTRR